MAEWNYCCDDVSQLSTGWDLESPERWVCGHSSGGLSWWGQLMWEDLPTVGDTSLWASILDCIKRRKWAEHKHPVALCCLTGVRMWPMASSCCCHGFYMVADGSLNLQAKINYFFLKLLLPGYFTHHTDKKLRQLCVSHLFFIHSPVAGHLGWVHVLAVMNNTEIDLSLKTHLWCVALD